ncbi:MAG: hypothetical protein GY722_27220, partial [bacterium]|nr:hypothetical protein [bacterium]
LKVAIDPASHPSIFTTKHTMGLQTTGSSILQFGFDPVNKISCPAIIKLQSTSTVADTDMSAGFNLRVVKGP